jgi:hypothetical protein
MKTTQSFKAEFKVSKLALFPLIVKNKSKLLNASVKEMHQKMD